MPKVPPTTADIGILIRDRIEDDTMQIFDWATPDLDELDQDEIISVDVSDPSNIVITTGSGAIFTARIVRTA